MSKSIILFFGLILFCSCNNSKNEKSSDPDSTEQSTGLPPEDNHVMENNVTTQRQENIDEEKLRILDSIKVVQQYQTLVDTAMVMVDTIVKK